MTDKTNVQKWIKKNRYEAILFEFWNKSIWKKSYEEIVEYLTERLDKTSSELEYYYCLLCLENNLPEKLRYLPYKESDQYKRSIGVPVNTNIIQLKVKTFSTFSKMR